MPKERTNVFGLILFALVGLTALILGVIQYGQKVKKPFEPDPVAVAALQAQLKAQEVDRTKDTDGDGIPDYDELNVFRTSPYLKDSDSDGVDDKTEIARNTDPNCPEGKDCGTPPPPIAPANLNAGPSDENIPVELPPLPTELSGNVNAGADTAQTAEAIRQVLRDSGVTDDVLTSLSDDELIKLYDETAAEVNANGNVNATP
jgi:hypothetical protein